MYEVEIVSGSMILRESPPDTAHQAPDRQIEARGTVLSLVISVRREIHNLRARRGMEKHMRGGPIDFRIPSPTLLVVKPAAVPNAGQYEPVSYIVGLLSISREPGDGTDRPGNEQK